MVGEGCPDGSTQQCGAAAGVPSPQGAPEHFIHHTKPPAARRTRCHERHRPHGLTSAFCSLCAVGRSSAMAVAAAVRRGAAKAAREAWQPRRGAGAVGIAAPCRGHRDAPRALRARFACSSACLCRWGRVVWVSEHVRTRLYACILVFRSYLYVHRIWEQRLFVSHKSMGALCGLTRRSKCRAKLRSVQLHRRSPSVQMCKMWRAQEGACL